MAQALNVLFQKGAVKLTFIIDGKLYEMVEKTEDKVVAWFEKLGEGNIVVE
jgi:hypothetical protein